MAQPYATETEVHMAHHHSNICWKSVIAGLFVTFLTMTLFSALGMAFGGIGLYDGSSLKSASIFAASWMVISVALSLMAGAFFAARVSRFTIGRVGSAQGLVVAAIFFSILAYQAAGAVGAMGKAAGSLVAGSATAAARTVATASDSPMINEIVEDTLGDLNVPPERIQAVVTGTATRLLSGNPESAKNYLARQTNITPAEAESRLATARAQAEEAAVSARQATAQAMKTTGFTVLALIILGAAAAIFGGSLGAGFNNRNPMTREVDARSTDKRRATNPSYT